MRPHYWPLNVKISCDDQSAHYSMLKKNQIWIHIVEHGQKRMWDGRTSKPYDRWFSKTLDMHSNLSKTQVNLSKGLSTYCASMHNLLTFCWNIYPRRRKSMLNKIIDCIYPRVYMELAPYLKFMKCANYSIIVGMCFV